AAGQRRADAVGSSPGLEPCHPARNAAPAPAADPGTPRGAGGFRHALRPRRGGAAAGPAARRVPPPRRALAGAAVAGGGAGARVGRSGTQGLATVPTLPQPRAVATGDFMQIFLNPGLIALTLGYTLSQFYRAFLAVLSPTLEAELGASPGDLALSSGMWFIAFALMQLPVGWALDRIGPRRTVAAALALGGGGGAAVFALATQPWHLHLAMGLIGAGCAPALMAAYYIIAHDYPRHVFAALSGMMIGLGSLGNILGAAPLVGLIHGIGWRQSLWLLAAVTLVVAALEWVVVRDPRHEGDPPRGSILDILRL